MEYLRRFWIIARSIIAIWTILTLMTFFFLLFPDILDMQIIRANHWMAYIIVIVMFFWIGYIGLWGAGQFKYFRKKKE